jgi:hypothetical protein
LITRAGHPGAIIHDIDSLGFVTCKEETKMPSRREFLKIGGASAAFYALARNRLLRKAFAAPLAMGLSDPALQPKFAEYVPNALDPGFIFEPLSAGPRAGDFNVYIRQSVQQTGLVSANSGKKLDTKIWGYGYDDARGVT